MPTSSQSQILSVVDYQLLQQQASGQNAQTKPPVRISVNQTQAIETIRRLSKDERRPSIDRKNGTSPTFPRVTDRRRSSDKTAENPQATRTTQRNDVLHMPVINLHQTNQKTHSDNRQARINNTYGRTKSSLADSSVQSFPPHPNSFHSDHDELNETLQQLNQLKKYTTPRSGGENSASPSDLDNTNDDDDEEEEENFKQESRSGLLDDNARRLLVLGTIRPSRTFYKNLPEADVDHLMEYFRRMKHTQQRMTSEEINAELATKFVEYKPKIFFDSACVTKGQVISIEKLIEQYADKIRTHKAEFVKLENPMRFVIKPVDNDTPLTTIPREYNDCFITLVTRSDPLRRSELVANLVQEKLLQDIKANSLDISYFPGGVNYDVPRDEIDENGQMNVETYQKLKKRLNNRKVWYFTGPPEKKPNALLAIVPFDSSIIIDHQHLYNDLNECLKTLPNNENTNTQQRILSIEFVPLSCILSSNDISNQFIIDCDSIETKRHIMEKPLKVVSNKQSVMLEFQSYDETMQREYEKFIKSEKYRELVKNHDAAVKRSSSTK